MRFFAGEYHTKPDKPRKFMDRLMLNSRGYFWWRYFGIILRARRAALEGTYGREGWAKSSYDVLTLIEDCGGRFHLSGLDNLQLCEGPVVFVSNHMSTLETMVFPCVIAPMMDVTFVVKESLVSHPFLGPVLRSRKPIVVSRSNSREDLQNVLSKGQELLAAGVSVIIFPQSTRSVEFSPKEFNSLGVKLAARAGVQLVPIAIKTDFWQNGKYLKDLGPLKREKPIHMAFGRPLTVEGGGKETHKQVLEFIGKKLEKWS